MYNNQMKKNAIMNTFKNVWSVPYCGISTIEKIIERNGYTAGKYGWNANVYVIDCDNVIVTGPRAFGIPIPKDIYKTYEDTAKYINEKITDYTKKEKAMKTLLHNLSQSATFDKIEKSRCGDYK